MLDWIAGYVARWTGYVEQNTRGLVQWGLHALAGVVYAVFGNVGKAWAELALALAWMHKEAGGFAGWVVAVAERIIRLELPRLWSYAVGAFRAAETLATRLWQDAVRRVAAALSIARALVSALWQLVLRDVWQPLMAITKQLRADLLKWGYVAWFYVTHPDKLAPVLLGALIGAAEAAFGRIAAPAGIFALRLIVHQLPALLRLAETIVTAVL
jgi:hypothetical protein